MQTVLHMPQSEQNELRGRFLRSENGGRPSLSVAFAPDALLGFHLSLPRKLGTLAVTLVLSADGDPRILTLPLSWSGMGHGNDRYNALLALSMLSARASFFTYRIELETAYGHLFACKKDGEEIAFSAFLPTEEEEFCFYLYRPNYALLTDGLGGATYAVSPISQHTGAPILEKKEFFAHLSRLGVNALWLVSDKKEDRKPWRAERVLPSSVRRSAQESGVRIYPDFWLAAGLSGNIGYFFEEGTTRTPTGETGEPMPESCGVMPVSSLTYGERRPCCDHFCGPDGTVAAWMRAGADGFFVRAADGVGDAFLSVVREKIAEEDGRALFGVLRTHRPGDIAFGVRRRFFLGGEFEGCVTPSLRAALYGYLTEGKTNALRHFFTEELPCLPTPVLHSSFNALSLPGERFFDTLPENADREALAQLAYLIAATLPGNPLIFAGDEWGDGEENGENTLYAFYLRVAKMRLKEAVYRDGALRLLHLDRDLLVFSREREGEALLTVINRLAAPLFLSGDFTVLFGGRGRKTQFALPPLGGAVCRVSLWPGEEGDLLLSRSQPAAAPVPNAAEKSEILHFATHGVL